MHSTITLDYHTSTIRVLSYKQRYWIAVEDLHEIIGCGMEIFYHKIDQWDIPSTMVRYYYHKDLKALTRYWFIAPTGLVMLANAKNMAAIQAFVCWLAEDGLPAACVNRTQINRRQYAHCMMLARQVSYALAYKQSHENQQDGSVLRSLVNDFVETCMGLINDDG